MTKFENDDAACHAPGQQPCDMDAPDPKTPVDQTRDLALSHVIERFADGEIRPDEMAEVERQIAQIPNAADRIRFERALRAACGQAMSVVPIDPECRQRVHEAARLRLRGEADALAQVTTDGQTTPQVAGRIEPAAVHSPRRTVTLGRLAIAASLVLAGFLGAQFTTSDQPKGSSLTDSVSAGLGLDLSDASQRTERLAEARMKAESFLDGSIVLPEGPNIYPNRFDFGPDGGKSRSVGFRYAVRVPGQAELAAVNLFIQQESTTRVNPGQIIENAQGDVYWSMRQEGDLLYHIQSESKQAVRVLSEALGWPSADPDVHSPGAGATPVR